MKNTLISFSGRYHLFNKQAYECSSAPYLLGGLLVGVLTGGLALAIVVSLWLTTPLSESTTTTIGKYMSFFTKYYNFEFQ